MDQLLASHCRLPAGTVEVVRLGPTLAPYEMSPIAQGHLDLWQPHLTDVTPLEERQNDPVLATPR